MLRRYDILSGDHWHDVVERESSTGRSVDYDDALALIRAAFMAGHSADPLDEAPDDCEDRLQFCRDKWLRENVTGEVKP